MYGNLGDKEMMSDVLSGQKMIASIYNTFSNECTNDALRTDMLTILREEHNMQADVFNEMKKRGWYAPANAEQTAVQQAKTKYTGIQSTL
ncbi:MAG: spore coat protein [Ruminococcaceae bacterium]|nr:spore coat protein [Oscillospiraceae bacterium]